MQFTASNQAEPLMHLGAGTGDIGLVGVSLCGWLYLRSQKHNREPVTLLTVLRRSNHND